jgi:cellulose synthase/poly-beta-1,6-N-acetylglucosamine synthase-like glycosyltransferase
MPGAMWLTVARGALLALEIALAIPALYLAVMTIAALWASWQAGVSRKPLPELSASEWPQLVVLIPAHNEEQLIERFLTNLRGLDYPQDRHAIYVIADNCDDSTAALAGAYSWAHTLVRTDTEQRSKGYAIAWALDWLAQHDVPYDACVLFDADSIVEPRCLKTLATAYLRGADVVQGQNVVLNAFEAPSASLRWLALTLMNHIRQLGRSTLGASCSLTGNGMLFSAALLQRRPWQAFGLTEDCEYYFHLVEHGEKVRYAPDALVRSDMPTTFAQMRSQDIRWESNANASLPVVVLRLLRAAVHLRSAIPLEAVLEVLVPPLSLLVGAACFLLVGALALGWFPNLVMALGIWVCVILNVSSALVLERPPLKFYQHLAYAPVYVCWKFWVKLVAVRLPRRSQEWVRTSRAVSPR